MDYYFEVIEIIDNKFSDNYSVTYQEACNFFGFYEHTIYSRKREIYNILAVKCSQLDDYPKIQEKNIEILNYYWNIIEEYEKRKNSYNRYSNSNSKQENKMNLDYYQEACDFFGFTKDTNFSEKKKIYSNLVKIYHPDYYKNDGSEEKIKKKEIIIGRL